MEQFAVLTGDIVKSTALPRAELDATMDAIHRAAVDISGWNGRNTTGFARRGGDGWQIVTQAHEYALRASLYIQASIRSRAKDRATRISVALGDGPLPKSVVVNPNYGFNPAFIASGRRLDQLTGNALFAHAALGTTGAAFRLADHIAQGWTPPQALALKEALPPGPKRLQKEIGMKLGISRQAVGQALSAAGFDAIHTALTLIEDEETRSKDIAPC